MTQFYLIGFFVLMIFDTMAQIGFKLAASHADVPHVLDFAVIISWIIQVMSKHWIYFSLAGYVGAFITWMTLLKHAPIGPAFAASHLEIVSVMIISVIFFHEKLTVLQVVGSLLILGGIFVLASEAGTEGKKQTAEEAELLLALEATGETLSTKSRQPAGRLRP
jgi:multidrug transporter EmrE-like cation transporter